MEDEVSIGHKGTAGDIDRLEGELGELNLGVAIQEYNHKHLMEADQTMAQLYDMSSDDQGNQVYAEWSDPELYDELFAEEDQANNAGQGAKKLDIMSLMNTQDQFQDQDDDEDENEENEFNY